MNPDRYRPQVSNAVNDRKAEVRDTHRPWRRHWWTHWVCKVCCQSWPCRQAEWARR